MFTPRFNDFVQGIAPNGVTFQIRPEYCLNLASAIELKGILADLQPMIVMGSPEPNAHGDFTYLTKVPFFRFPDGKVRNAAILADYWTFGGISAENALKYCLADIAEDYTGAELLA